MEEEKIILKEFVDQFIDLLGVDSIRQHCYNKIKDLVDSETDRNELNEYVKNLVNA